MQSARDAYDNKNYQQAANYLDEELKENPDNGEAYALYGDINNDFKYYGPAMFNYRKALVYLSEKQKETAYRVKRNMAEALFKLDRDEEAVKLLESAAKEDESYKCALALCRMRIRGDGAAFNPQKALAELKKIDKKVGKDEFLTKPTIYSYIVEALWNSGKRDEAIAKALEVEDKELSSVRARQDIVKVHYKMGLIAEAATHAAEFTIGEKISGTVSGDYLIQHLSHGDYDATVAAFDNACNRHKAEMGEDSYTSFKTQKGFEIALNCKVSRDIIKNRGILSEQKYDYIYEGIASAYIDLGAYGKAQEVIDQWENDKNTRVYRMWSSWLYLTKASLCIATSDLEAAAENVRKAIEHSPSMCYSHLVAADIALMDSKMASAEAYADTAMAIANNWVNNHGSDHLYACVTNIRLALLKGDKQRAATMAQEAVETEDETSDDRAKSEKRLYPILENKIHTGLSCIAQAALGNEGTVDSYTKEFGYKGSRLFRDNWYWASIAYTILGNKDKAFGALRTAIENGFCDFSRIEHTPELKWMRTERPDDYAQLMERAKEMLSERLQTLD